MSEDPDRNVQSELTGAHVLDRLLGTGAVIGGDAILVGGDVDLVRPSVSRFARIGACLPEEDPSACSDWATPHDVGARTCLC
jgi:hypothetical protein